jgi:hypothetical protein
MKQCDPGDDLVLAAAAISLSLARGRSSDEIALLAELTGAVSQNLSLIAAKLDLCDQTSSSPNA